MNIEEYTVYDIGKVWGNKAHTPGLTKIQAASAAGFCVFPPKLCPPFCALRGNHYSEFYIYHSFAF